MGQNTYAEWFINMMLGWIRWIANGIAKTFQSGSSRGGSSGASFLSWFSNNWMMLLIILVVAGILIDWLVWMIRWRPYWLWFRKKRILLDDDVDAILRDEDIMQKLNEVRPKKPRFQASALGRGGRPIPVSALPEAPVDELFDIPEPIIEEADYSEFDPDIEDPYLSTTPLDDEWEIEETTPIKRAFKGKTPKFTKSEPFDDLYGDDYNPKRYQNDEPDESDGPVDDDEPDISFIEGDEFKSPRKRKNWLERLRHRRPIEDEDPFSVDDDTFYDPEEDTDFFKVVSGAPEYLKYDPEAGSMPLSMLEPQEELIEPETPTEDDEFASLYPTDAGNWKTGYSEHIPITHLDEKPSRRNRRREKNQ